MAAPKRAAGVARARRTQTIRGRTAPAVKNAAVFEAGSVARRTAAWRPPTTSPNTSMLGSLSTMRARSREAVRNDGYGKAFSDRQVNNIIGTGMIPLSKAEDVAFRGSLQALWLRWTDESDADGVLEFYGQQSQAVRECMEAGEVFVRLRPRLPSDGLSVPLQLQIIEPELCPHLSGPQLAPNGNRIRAGIELDALGRRQAYWFYPSRTNDADEADYSTLKRIPAESVIHLYEPLRAGQLRGQPMLTPVLVRLHELDVMEDAVLRHQQVANLFAGFIRRPAQDGNAAQLNPLTGEPVDTTDSVPLVSLEDGLMQELEPGEEVTFSQPPDVGSMYPDFMRQQLIGAAAGTGVPYEVLTGDLSKVNDRTVRVILQEFRRRIQSWQHQIFAHQFCRAVWNAWLDRVFLSGALPIPVAYLENPEPWRRVEWKPQGWQYLNPYQDMQALKGLVRSGFTSRTAIVSEQGEDADAIDEQQSIDNKRADALGLIYDTDPRQVSNAGLTQARPDGSTNPAPGDFADGGTA